MQRTSTRLAIMKSPNFPRKKRFPINFPKPEKKPLTFKLKLCFIGKASLQQGYKHPNPKMSEDQEKNVEFTY